MYNSILQRITSVWYFVNERTKWANGKQIKQNRVGFHFAYYGSNGSIYVLVYVDLFIAIGTDKLYYRQGFFLKFEVSPSG
jgi:hypothetical protein